MSTKPIAMRDALLERIWLSMRDDESIFFTCADFGSPVLDKIREQFPDRFINVGIAEQNLINVSAGLAIEGYKVFAYAIAPFITMRCYEQIRVSLALLSVVRPMNVNLIGVGAGYSYVVSGPTHQCYEDLTIMRALPNFRIFLRLTIFRRRRSTTIVLNVMDRSISVSTHRLFRPCTLIELQIPVVVLKFMVMVTNYVSWPLALWCIPHCKWQSV